MAYLSSSRMAIRGAIVRHEDIVVHRATMSEEVTFDAEFVPADVAPEGLFSSVFTNVILHVVLRVGRVTA